MEHLQDPLATYQWRVFQAEEARRMGDLSTPNLWDMRRFSRP
jgi:hypothetical protein